ncbi:MAG TPA: helix-turn-helix domain-containing protein [Candidatus Acutalibacter pullicola]|uniref:Helix-turn-helix domain-containing protein n=1 Tax=Candidatus Acutalibacter pullicola TaxID=2838417 RepID=A0A9D2SES8_9FIRM|nr:helix-turn-helix domain-containing protein [Candidatus Acutalibacter pullicola]
MQKLLQDKCLGTNIRRLRKAAGLTQPQLVAKIQVAGGTIGDVTTLAKIEAGVRNIRVSDLMALQSIFACDYSEFFRGL